MGEGVTGTEKGGEAGSAANASAAASQSCVQSQTRLLSTRTTGPSYFHWILGFYRS